MIEIDRAAGTGTCAHCGPVPLAWKRRDAGDPTLHPRCSIARQEQRESPGRQRDRAHGLSSAESLALRQEYGCALCGLLDPVRTKVDHCHETGLRRDVLCSNHNLALGLFGDDPAMLRAAADYVERWRKIHGDAPR